mgnify:CR=1 FL=1
MELYLGADTSAEGGAPYMTSASFALANDKVMTSVAATRAILYTAEPSEVQYSAVMYAYNAEEPVVTPETVFFSTERQRLNTTSTTAACPSNGSPRASW